MTNREAPGSADEIYAATNGVPPARPILQGDIFRDVMIPGFDRHHSAMIIQHPCSMRMGAKLRPRLTMAIVRSRAARINAKDWQGNGAVMLLPDLYGDGAGYEADFRDSGTVASSTLERSMRVAALSEYGIHVLQQRLVHYMTRLTARLSPVA
jgi:hypothetical protein